MHHSYYSAFVTLSFYIRATITMVPYRGAFLGDQRHSFLRRNCHFNWEKHNIQWADCVKPQHGLVFLWDTCFFTIQILGTWKGKNREQIFLQRFSPQKEELMLNKIVCDCRDGFPLWDGICREAHSGYTGEGFEELVSQQSDAETNQNRQCQKKAK